MMAGRGFLTTHILDTGRGCPAGGVRIDLFHIEGETRTHLSRHTTNEDGRTDSPLITVGDLKRGTYELVFQMGAYFSGSVRKTDIPFVDSVPIRFGIEDGDSHYHVPLLASPFSYSTYRGS